MKFNVPLNINATTNLTFNFFSLSLKSYCFKNDFEISFIL